MEAALTFGSLGDILALCQVAVQLSRALGGGCQALGVRAALKSFPALFTPDGIAKVIATYQEREPYVYLSQLDNVTKDAVRDCTDLVEEALRHFQSKYGSSLQQGGSGNKLRDARKKIEWSLREKERLRELRGKLSRNTQRLLLLCALTAQKSARVDNATMIMRIDHVRQLVEAQEGCHEEMLRLLQEQEKLSTTQTEQLENVNKQLVTQSHDIHGAVTIAKQSFMAIVEIKDALTMVASNLSELRTFVFRFLDPTKELPVTIEDALGRRLPIPPEWLDCMQWETFYSLLQDQFRGQKGYLMVCQRQFVLEEDITGKDIAQTQPLGVCLRRGMKISMGMIFTVDLLSGMCPRCQTMNEAPEGLTTIQCRKSGCNLRFRLTEVTSATEGTAAPVVQVISAESSEAKPSDFVLDFKITGPGKSASKLCA
ncbi:hypothetical protein OQA88_12270 [Cercophora sp. LCS_1]